MIAASNELLTPVNVIVAVTSALDDNVLSASVSVHVRLLSFTSVTQRNEI